MYTRVALYINWILKMESSDLSMSTVPIQQCPGEKCVWGDGLCIARHKKCDGVVDCLGTLLFFFNFNLNNISISTYVC